MGSIELSAVCQTCAEDLICKILYRCNGVIVDVKPCETCLSNAKEYGRMEAREDAEAADRKDPGSGEEE